MTKKVKTMKNYHADTVVEVRNNLVYVDGKLVGHIDEDNSRKYWEFVLREQNKRGKPATKKGA